MVFLNFKDAILMARISSYATGEVSHVKRYDNHKGDRIVPYNYQTDDREKWEVSNKEVDPYGYESHVYEWGDTPSKRLVATAESYAFWLWKKTLKEDPEKSKRWTQTELTEIDEFEKRTTERLLKEITEEMNARESYRRKIDTWNPGWDEQLPEWL